HTVVGIDGFGPVFFSHATPRDDEEIVLVGSRLERWAEVHQYLPADIAIVVCGYTHMPFARLANSRLVINPGSVGLPYGRNGAHWAVLSTGAVTLGRTLIDTEHLVREVAAASTIPDCAEWAAKNVRHSASDIDAVASL
ncbi:metallophosphoesterase family protein, partial [Bacillus sp. S34]|nr:metallophosphoesterase family protein [Bacillus sp. S34]